MSGGDIQKITVPDAARKTVAETLMQFDKLGKVPLNINIARLNDGSGIETTLKKNSAKWHKTCANKCNKLKLERLQEKTEDDEQEPPCSPVKTCRLSPIKPLDPVLEVCCYFCDKEAGPKGLHEVKTLGIDDNISHYATELQDTHMLAKLATADMRATDAHYHKTCETSYINRFQAHISSKTKASSNSTCAESVAIAELVSYIKDEQSEKDIAPVFKLSDLGRMYATRLEQLGVELSTKINTTRLKNRLLPQIPKLYRAHDHG